MLLDVRASPPWRCTIGERDGEAEAGAAVAGRSRFVETGEAVEHPLAILRRDARTVVGDGQHDRLSPRATNVEPDVRHRVACRVVGEVAHDPRERGAVAR